MKIGGCFIGIELSALLMSIRSTGISRLNASEINLKRTLLNKFRLVNNTLYDLILFNISYMNSNSLPFLLDQNNSNINSNFGLNLDFERTRC